VVASAQSLPAKAVLNAKEVSFDTPTEPKGQLAEKVAWMAPAFGGGKQVAVVGIGPRSGRKQYSEADLFWLEDFADQVGALVFAQGQRFQRKKGQARAGDAKRADTQAGSEGLLKTLAFMPDAELAKDVEESLRNLNDYIKLGGSPLVEILGVHGKTNIERGKAAQRKLIEVLETLRPGGQKPPEPLPREWHSYVILHDAYVDEVPDREIMARLYVSEGTFYRARRKALHGISRAILEMESGAQ